MGSLRSASTRGALLGARGDNGKRPVHPAKRPQGHSRSHHHAGQPLSVFSFGTPPRGRCPFANTRQRLRQFITRAKNTVPKTSTVKAAV